MALLNFKIVKSMKKIILIFAISLTSTISVISQTNSVLINNWTDYTDTTLSVPSKTNFNSWGGVFLVPDGQYRVLSIFVNIIYDIPSVQDPCPASSYESWAPATSEGINNQSIPSYLLDFSDINYTTPSNVHGMFTRLYYEASFGNLIFLSDYMVVNIKHSTIIAQHPNTYTFYLYELATSVMNFINSHGGLNTIYQHNSLSDYDSNNDGKIDVSAIFIRNGKVDNINDVKYYYGTSAGSGTSWLSFNNININGNSVAFQNQTGTNQCVGNGDFFTGTPINIFSHEVGHLFFGGNNFHTSGGNHFGTSSSSPFMGLQGGYGLMGCYSSGLQCTNGYERWRMHWRDVSNQNSNDWWIVARDVNNNNVLKNGDIQQSDGNQTFYLRDFVTYGDAIRIKLPYKDNNALNQYIWIENHQVGINNKIDYLSYSTTSTCRDDGMAGIYAYYQVGRDVLTSTVETDVRDYINTDNLKIISAEGNWDFQKLNKEDVGCVGWNTLVETESMTRPNPFNGFQDQQNHIFPKETPSYNTLQLDDCVASSVKYNFNGQGPIKNLCNLGDNLDAFTNNTELSLSTNPASVNTTTNYTYQYYSGDTPIFNPANTTMNERTIYLSGLSVKLYSNTNNTYRVDVRWDDYDVKNDVNWTGNIVMNEQLNLLSNKTITLDQNYTPDQHTRDLVSGQFAKTTVFTCGNGSVFHQLSSSDVVLKNHSSLKISSGAKYIIENNSELLIKSGCSLYIEDCADLVINGTGKLTVESGATIYISSNAILDFENGSQNLNLISGYIIPSGYSDPLDLLPPTTISSNITWANKTYYVRNLTLTQNAILTLQNARIVFTSSTGKLLVQQSAKLVVDNSTLTSSIGCINNPNNPMWKGIEVWGTSNQTQYGSNSPYQGKLEVINGGSIENAEVAVYLGKRDSQGLNISGFEGGIITATNASFKNNKEGVVFKPYHNFLPTNHNLTPNLSQFKTCNTVC